MHPDIYSDTLCSLWPLNISITIISRDRYNQEKTAETKRKKE